ncbi:MAG: helix-turn-helix transcriptional regulator [Pseudomonadota bacterium]
MGTPGTGIDRFIGDKVKWRRREKKLMMDIVALKLGMPLKEYKAAEAGRCRFTSEQLVQLSGLLGLEVDAFFPDVEPNDDRSVDPMVAHPSADELYDMIHYFSGIAHPDTRRLLIDWVRRLSSF